MKKRVEWVDVGKYICIMFVMLSHLESSSEIIRKFYSPFFLNTFLFMSGYVFNRPDSFKTHIRKKIYGLFIPWFVFSNLNILLSSVVTLKGDRDWKHEVLWNAIQINGFGDGLWFIAALFVAFIPFYFVTGIKNRRVSITISFLMALLSSVYCTYFPGDILPWGTYALPWHLEYIFTAVFWMILGYYYKECYEDALSKYTNVAFMISVCIIYLLIVYFPVKIAQPGNIIFSFLKSLIGVTIIVLISKRIRSNRYIAYVGANTLVYFALHGKVYAVMEYILSRKASFFYDMCLNNALYSNLLSIALTILMSFILIVPAYCINRWVPWIIGRKKN